MARGPDGVSDPRRRGLEKGRRGIWGRCCMFKRRTPHTYEMYIYNYMIFYIIYPYNSIYIYIHSIYIIYIYICIYIYITIYRHIYIYNTYVYLQREDDMEGKTVTSSCRVFPSWKTHMENPRWRIHHWDPFSALILLAINLHPDRGFLLPRLMRVNL